MMQSPYEWKRRLKALLAEPVAGLDEPGRLSLAHEYLRELGERRSPLAPTGELVPTLEIVPFHPSGRPLDEALAPGTGTSESSGFLTTGEHTPGGDELWILYQLKNLEQLVLLRGEPVAVTLSATFLPSAPGEAACAVPSLQGVPVEPRVVSSSSYPVPALEAASVRDFAKTRFVAALPPEALLPAVDGAPGYAWDTLDPTFRERVTDGRDPFTFSQQFHQRVRIDLELRSPSRALSRQSSEVEIFDLARMGSLYSRILDRLIRKDTELQAKALSAPDAHFQYHPWFPVVAIGMDKAGLYVRGIRQDLGRQQRNLPDPAWLVRVGLYLELLTCLGIFDAVHADHPDLLTPEERRAYLDGARYERARAAVDADAWRAVWALRRMEPRGTDAFSAGPVSVLNLRRKQLATLAFLHTHHEDLKRALELAGPNPGSSQETWHRVFRDAERAVFRNARVAFPELGHLEASQRELALWHQRGDLKLFGRVAVPGALTGLFGDQDALFPSACRQYRASMNDVARWARAKGLMDYTGAECIPRNASLLEATMAGNQALVASLQRRDGYEPSLESEDRPFEASLPTHDQVLTLLERVSTFRPLMERERERLARSARRIVAAPLDRVVVEGQPGASLFVVASGELEVLVRDESGADVAVATLEAGSVFGEIALLTGAPRAATVRAVSDAVLFELGKPALAPIIEARPQLVLELSMLMAARQVESRERTSKVPEVKEGLASRIRRFFFG
jgi:hypothetical protein